MTTIKLDADHAPVGPMGQIDLVAGNTVGLRLWRDEQPVSEPVVTRRAYETVGYVIAGAAELTIEGETIRLNPGDSWLVPAEAEHSYRIIEAFTAVEATAPPARGGGG